MEFLVVNDDGIFAPGLATLVESIRPFGKVTVIAPDKERSGASHALTMDRPLRLSPAEEGYVLDGTPVDCVKMGLEGLGLRPDFVLSGINQGSNLGTDVLYSGTVAAAMEAVVLGVPAVAFSLCGSLDYLPGAGELIRRFLFTEPALLHHPDWFPPQGLLNVNIPALPLEKIRGIRLTRLGVCKYENVLEKQTDPEGSPIYWMRGKFVPPEESDLDTDLGAVENGYISVTPLKFDLTQHDQIPVLTKLLAKEYM